MTHLDGQIRIQIRIPIQTPPLIFRHAEKGTSFWSMIRTVNVGLSLSLRHSYPVAIVVASRPLLMRNPMAIHYIDELGRKSVGLTGDMRKIQ